jgi:CHAD domain-containing protein
VGGGSTPGVDPEAIRVRAHRISEGPDAETPEQDWLRAEGELAVAHDYDTVEFDLERLGMVVSRIPLEAGVTWRLRLPRGEVVEAWEPGNRGLVPPPEIERLIGGVVTGRELVPMPPLSPDEGAVRLRELIDVQRRALLAHDPGTRLGDDPENLHRHRVAARRTRAYLRAARRYLDPGWYRSLVDPLRELGAVTGPARDLDVLTEYVRAELPRLDESERVGGDELISRLSLDRDVADARLVAVLDGDSYRRLLARLRLRPRLADGVDAVPLDRLVRKPFRRAARAVEQLDRDPDGASVHRLRITLKRARYAAELSLPAGAKRDRFLTRAKTLQSLLGDYQDAVVAERSLRSVSVVDSSTAAAFVAGRIAERQVARRERVTEQLPHAWKRLRASDARLR